MSQSNVSDFTLKDVREQEDEHEEICRREPLRPLWFLRATLAALPSPTPRQWIVFRDFVAAIRFHV